MIDTCTHVGAIFSDGDFGTVLSPRAFALFQEFTAQ